jgi:UV DNA damage endonuclease
VNAACLRAAGAAQVVGARRPPGNATGVRVRFGFVAMAPSLADASPARTVTATAAARMSPDERLYRLRRTARANLESTLRILRHASAHGIQVYRFSFHPDHYAPLGSPRSEVQAAARRDYAYHARMVAAMGLGGRVRLVVHVGGGYGDPDAAAGRFAAAAAGLEGFREALAVENDDRVHDGTAVLALARRAGIPCVLDFHHQRVLRGDGGLVELARSAAETWVRDVPKFHLSSPASPTRPRDHAAFVTPEDAHVALAALGAAGVESADVMLEAKAKDAAVFRLVEELAATGRWVRDGEAAVRGGPRPR